MMRQPGLNYAAWEIEPLDELPASPEEAYRHLVGWAILAANSHNVQPWRFVFNLDRQYIDVCVDGSGILPASDKNARQAYISVGCALENLLCAAEYYNIDYRLEPYEGKPVYPDPIMRVHLPITGSHERGDEKLVSAMKQRRMNRGEFDSQREVPEAILQEIRSFADDRGLISHVITDKLTRYGIADIQRKADSVVIQRTEFREELAEFFLPNDTLEGRGMPGGTFGLGDDMAEAIHTELKKSGKFDPRKAAMFSEAGRLGLRSARAIVVLSVRDDTPKSWLEAGRALQRAALIAESNSLVIAVHAAMVEEKTLNRLLKARLRLLRGRPTVIFRIGYATEERPHSPRVNVGSVTEVA